MSEKSNILCVIILFGAVYGFVHSTTDDELLLFKTDGLFAKTHTIKKKIAFVLESYQRQMEQLKALQKYTPSIFVMSVKFVLLNKVYNNYILFFFLC